MSRSLPSSTPRSWPVFQALRGASARSLGGDLAAGLTLAAIAVPEQMATARLGGFEPQIGLLAFVVAAIGFAIFGGARQLSAGADSTITPIFAGSIALMAIAGSPHYLALAAVLALMVGGLVALSGLLKLGWIADLLSAPIITGFLAGIALHILLSQAPPLLGLGDGAGNVYRRLASLLSQARLFHPAALAIGVGVYATIAMLEKLNPRIPGALIALAGASTATALLDLQPHGVTVLGALTGVLPHPALPIVSFGDLLRLSGLAAIIALVVMVQTAATTRAFSGEGGDPDVNRDFVGVGAANLLTGLLGAFPINASPPRTAIAADAGARSQFSGLFAALTVLALATFGRGLLAYIPIPALAGTLVFVASRIFHLGTFLDILRRTPAEFALALLTTVLIVLLPIETGAAIGVFLSLAHGVFTTTRTKPIFFEPVPDTTIWWPASPTAPAPAPGPVLVMGFQAPLSFLNAHDFRRGVLAAIAARKGITRLLVLEASSIVEMDFTAAKTLSEVIAAARDAGMAFAVARLESLRAQQAFERFGIMAELGPDHIFRSVDAAIQALEKR